MTDGKRPTAAQLADRVAELEARVAELEARVAELEARVAELEKALVRRDPRVPGRPSVKQK